MTARPKGTNEINHNLELVISDSDVPELSPRHASDIHNILPVRYPN